MMTIMQVKELINLNDAVLTKEDNIIDDKVGDVF